MPTCAGVKFSTQVPVLGLNIVEGQIPDGCRGSKAMSQGLPVQAVTIEMRDCVAACCKDKEFQVDFIERIRSNDLHTDPSACAGTELTPKNMVQILRGDGAADGSYYRGRVFLGTDGAPVTLQVSLALSRGQRCV